jgi:hypothetical protein
MRVIVIFFLLSTPVLYAFDSILPAPVSMGGGYAAISDGYEAVYQNPAGLALNKTYKITVSQVKLYFDTYDYETGFFGGFPDDKSNTGNIKTGFAFGFGQQIQQNAAVMKKLLNPDGTPMIDPITGEIKQEIAGFADKMQSMLNVGAAMSLGNVSIGFSSAGMEIQHGSLSAWGIGVNAGILYKMMPELRLGAAVINAGRTRFFWQDGRNDYEPMKIDAGAAYMLFERILLAADIGYFFDGEGAITWGIGAEVKIFDILKLRAGYADNKARFGFVFIADKLRVDYAFITNTNFYEAGRLSATLEF